MPVSFRIEQESWARKIKAQSPGCKFRLDLGSIMMDEKNQGRFAKENKYLISPLWIKKGPAQEARNSISPARKFTINTAKNITKAH